MKLHFVTKNKHKVEEVSKIMSGYGIEVIQAAEEKIEEKEKSLKEVAEYNALLFYEKLGVPVVVEDTGIFFEAYPNFPGNHPKLMFNMLGYKGLLKLLEGEKKDAHFRSVASYYDGKTLKTVEGRLSGIISEKIYGKSLDVMPYERIFLIDGKPICDLSREEKNSISHRSEAFRKLGEWLSAK